MKKNLALPFIILSLFCFTKLNSQVLFYESFGGVNEPPVGGPYGGSVAYGTLVGGPGTWTFAPGFFLRNVDNQTPNAAVSYINEAWEVREDFQLNVANACAFSTSWYNPVGQANDFMWTPLIGPLPANVVLSWNGRAYDPLYPDGYEVRVMTSAGGPPTGGTGVIGNQITNSTQIFSTPAEGTGAWVNHSVNLNAYAGQSIYIGYRNTSNDQFIVVIDDITVQVITQYDAGLISTDTISEYTLIPKSQVSALPLGGSISNLGINTITNVGLKVDVLNGSMTQIYTTTSPLQNIAAGGNANFIAGTWTPPATPGTYTFKFYPVLTETDQQSNNDTLTQTLVISDTTYSRDDNTSVASLGIGAGNGGFLGNEFAINNSARLSAVNIQYNIGYIGEPLAAAVWAMSGGVPTTIVAYTDTLVYTSTGPTTYNIPISGGDFLLAPGNYAVTAIEFDSTLSIGQSTNIFTQNRTWINWPTNPLGTWANNEDFGAAFSKPYMIRAIIKPVCPSDIVIGTSATLIPCGNSVATATVTTTGSGPFSYVWSNGGTNPTDTALTAGINYITVYDDYSGCFETDTVDILNAPIPTSSITASANESCLGCNDGSATVTPSGGTPGYTYLWSPSGGTSATATNLAPGNYTVTITDTNNCTTTSTITIDAFVPSGIQNEIGLSTTQIYPNPSNGTFQIKASLQYQGKVVLEMMNVLGSVVYNEVFGIENELNKTLQLPLAPGVYLLQITAGKDRITQQVIIK